MDGQAHHAEQLKLEQDITEALERAAHHEATEDDISLLAWAAGIQRRSDGNHGKSNRRD